MTEPEPIASEMGVKPPYEFEAHEVRITQGGKIQAWVRFALKFFEENEEKALVLHTLPKGKSKQDKRTETGADDDGGPQDAPPDTLKDDTKRGISTSTCTIPRLISVVEIIKREYLAGMDAKKAPNLVGLYQYNEMGCLEEEEEKEERGEDRIKMITEALSGTKNVTTKRSPYMKITLCRKELDGMKERGWTAQTPLKRKLSKSAKGRLRKRVRKESENENRE